MLKVVDVCKRVEGHGDVKILLKNDEISLVNFEFDIYRGFENFLIGKKLLDIPKIVSRICGLCYSSQAIVSCKAIEDIYDVNVPEQHVLLRRLLMTGELIKSHSMNFFFQCLPDLLKIFNFSQKVLTPYELIKFNPQLTSNLYELIRSGNEINELFGGRSVHLISPFPGGIIYSPSRKNISLAKKSFQKSYANLEWIIDKVIDMFANQDPPNQYNLPNTISLGLTNNGNYDRYFGSVRIKETNKNLIEFEKQNYSSYFSKEIELRGIDYYFETRKNVIVGPFSRFNIVENYGINEVTGSFEAFNKAWKNSILFTNIIRLIEIYSEIYHAMQILDDPILTVKEKLPSLDSIKKAEGIGLLEAPRGLLLHHYHLDESGTIDRIKLFVASEFNIPLINFMITNYAQDLFEKTGDINLVKDEVQVIIRAFDPCISCITH
ncbi:MAG: nickel-dependent hydrogenase large subunit [Candidatus Thorarchaeota archaeon]